MKHILLAFDGSYYSDAALRYAIQLAKSEGAMIEGVFLEDVSAYHQFSPIFEAPDVIGIADEVLEELKSSTRQSIEENVAKFESSCRASGVHCEAEHEIGVPGVELIDRSMFTDILIIGAVTYFSNLSIQGDMRLVSDLLSHTHSPVIVVPEQFHELKLINFAFDGSSSSSFAIRQFLYLFPNLVASAKANLITVVRKEGEAVPYEAEMMQYLTRYKKNLYREVLQGKAREELLRYVKMSPESIVVMGAFGRNAFSQLFKPSTGKKLIRSNSVPIFIAHE